MKKLIVILILFLFVEPFGFTPMAMSQEQEVAGTFYGEPISRGNYLFIMRVVLSFSSPWGGIPKNREKLEERIWDDLVLSHEVHRQGISISREELEKKISETLKADKVSFNWKEAPDEYAQWVKEKLGISVEGFENQIQHLVQAGKLRKQVLDRINPVVTDEEAFAEFLNENHTLSVELVEFNELEKAQEFYEKVKKDPELWLKRAKKDKEKVQEDRLFRRPGFVALEFLMVMWKFPKKAVFEMIAMEVGDIYPPQPIYEGYGVFKILDIKKADESLFQDQKKSYFNQLHSRKKYQGFKDWLENLKKEADMQVYIEPPGNIFR